MKPKIVHLLPYDAIGGVEVAARTVPDGEHGDFSFEKCYLVAKPGVSQLQAITPYTNENDPRAFASAIAVVWRKQPQVAIGSLWRGYMLLIALKLLRPATTAVTFLHSAKDAHVVDRLLSRAAMFCSREIWVDSSATMVRVPISLQGRVKKISFLTSRTEVPMAPAAVPSFVFWGRLHRHKNPLRALKFFARVRTLRPSATFDIIGPDGGELARMQEWIARTGVGGVTFHGPLDRTRISEVAKRCTFYIQTSVKEGAAMSVMEAMQLGLIPVVTPAGQIRSYCQHDLNSLILEGSEDGALAKRVSALLDLPEELERLAVRAHDTWHNKPLYSENVIERCGILAASAYEEAVDPSAVTPNDRHG